MLADAECMSAAMVGQVTCMTMSPHMLHAHTSCTAQHTTCTGIRMFTNNKSRQENANHYNTTL